jgi:phage tail-like protein
MGMLDDDFFVRFVSLFQELATTLLDGADNIPNTVDVTVAPPSLVRWLGSWIAIDSIDASLPEELQRNLVHAASKTLSWRGTRRGLEDYLEVLTGSPAEVTESGAVVREIPEDDSPEIERPRQVGIHVHSLGWLSEGDFVELVADEIPANVQWELYLDDRRLWPALVSAEGGNAA